MCDWLKERRHIEFFHNEENSFYTIPHSRNDLITYEKVNQQEVFEIHEPNFEKHDFKEHMLTGNVFNYHLVIKHLSFFS